jgi:N-acetylglucosamine-6-sulfatase
MTAHPNYPYSFLLAASFLLVPASLNAAVTVSGTSFNYSQNFNTLPLPVGDQYILATGDDDWANDSSVAGWCRALSNGSTNKDFYGVPSGVAGNVPRFGNAGNADSNDRSIGAIAGNDVSIALGVVFEVGSGYEVTEVDLSYRGEQWFRTPDNTPKDSLQFEYKVLSSYNPASFNIYSETAWTAAPALDFDAIKENSNSKLDGNAAGNFAAVPTSGLVNVTFATAVAEGEFIAFRWRCDAPTDGEQSAGLFIDDFTANFTANATTPSDPKTNITSGPNFIIIVPDDHRWDATSYLQNRIVSDFGRVARYPYLTSPDSTPNMDRLATEGLYFDNGFVVYSLCSPSRATMLTGVQPFVHGIIANEDEFPLESDTYAKRMQAAGWSTGYFGKWHMGTQTERPGFDHVRTFYGQGSYYEADFYDETGSLAQTTGARDTSGAGVGDYDNWVDKVSTDYLLEYIDTRYANDERFLAFLGFKTPHNSRRTDGISNAPTSPNSNDNFRARFSGVSQVDVPNSLTQNGTAPVWKPDAITGNGGTNTEAYMELVAAIDAQVGRVLDKLDALGLAEDTVVIYISDNGYFHGEHGLGDKRAGYEESLRVPFMIRYPALQPSGAGLSPTSKIGLNLDIAPTILDIAGLPVPAHMQGLSLKPLIEGSTPSNWRDSFVFSYNDDPLYADIDPADMVGLRTESGYKLIRYAENSGWDELFNVQSGASNDDKYENNNYVADAGYVATLASLQSALEKRLGEVGLLQVEATRTGSRPFEMDFIGGDRYPYVVEKSTDLDNWTATAVLEGSGQLSTIDLTDGAPASWDLSVSGDTADYVISNNSGSPVAVQSTNQTLYLGSKSEAGYNDGLDPVLIFELPVLPANTSVTAAQLEIFAARQYSFADVDLWAIGIQGSTDPILEYHEDEPLAGNVKLQDRLMDYGLAALPTYTTVTSSLASGLAPYLRDFYESNPTYTGGQYLFLRINADINPLDQPSQGNDNWNFRVTSADSVGEEPILHIEHTPLADGEKEFYRVRYGISNVE